MFFLNINAFLAINFRKEMKKSHFLVVFAPSLRLLVCNFSLPLQKISDKNDK